MFKKTYRKSDKRAFTLVEILIVVAILGILVTIVVVNYMGAQARARDAKRVTDIESVQTALAMYYADHKSYPLSYPAPANSNKYNFASECDGPPEDFTDWSGSLDSVKAALIPDYLPSWPQDPRNKDPFSSPVYYCYIYASNGTDYNFILYGKAGINASEINWISQPELIDPVRDEVGRDCGNTNTTENDTISAWKIYTPGGKCWI